MDSIALREKLLQEKYRSIREFEAMKQANDKAFWDNVKTISTLVTTIASAAVAVAAMQKKG